MGGVRALAAHLLQAASHGSTAAACRHAAHNQSSSTIGGLVLLSRITPPEDSLPTFVCVRLPTVDRSRFGERNKEPS